LAAWIVVASWTAGFEAVDVAVVVTGLFVLVVVNGDESVSGLVARVAAFVAVVTDGADVVDSDDVTAGIVVCVVGLVFAADVAVVSAVDVVSADLIVVVEVVVAVDAGLVVIGVSVVGSVRREILEPKVR
jgi:hypothetical protein